MSTSQTSKFPLGQTVATPAVLADVPQAEITAAIRRHVSGDWGEVTPADGKANDDALKSGERIFSVYRSQAGITFWVITEADRSVTTVLLPEDY